MKKLTAAALAMLTLLSTHAHAGVVLDMLMKDTAVGTSSATKISADAGMIRLDTPGDQGDSDVSMIFRGNEFLILNHDDSTYMIIDESMLNAVSSQMSAAMKQMEATLAGLPAEQRAMMERMMKDRMKSFAPPPEAAEPALTIDSTGSGEWRSYSCNQYTVSDDSGKIQEICAASLDEIDGADEVKASFTQMAEFMKQLTSKLPFASGFASSPTAMMDRIDGFPVHTLHYENGKVTEEVSLESAVEQPIDAALFSPPQGYTKQEIMPGR